MCPNTMLDPPGTLKGDIYGLFLHGHLLDILRIIRILQPLKTGYVSAQFQVFQYPYIAIQSFQSYLFMQYI